MRKLNLKNFDFASQTAEILIKCSKGTYIRSIAHDLGKNLGCGAHLVKLIRTQAGSFFVKNSIPLENFETPEIVRENLINPVKMLDYPKIIVGDDEHAKIQNGVAIANNGLASGKVVILIYNDIINAVGLTDGKKILIKKVF